MSRDSEMDDALAALRAKRQTERDEAHIERLRATNTKSAKARPAQVQRVEVQPRRLKAVQGGKDAEEQTEKSGGCALIALVVPSAGAALAALSTMKGWI